MSKTKVYNGKKQSFDMFEIPAQSVGGRPAKTQPGMSRGFIDGAPFGGPSNNGIYGKKKKKK